MKSETAQRCEGVRPAEGLRTGNLQFGIPNYPPTRLKFEPQMKIMGLVTNPPVNRRPLARLERCGVVAPAGP
jgi:hypothetical protein